MHHASEYFVSVSFCDIMMSKKKAGCNPRKVLPAISNKPSAVNLVRCPMRKVRSNTTMITLYGSDFNLFSQESYDFILDTLDLHQVECTCGRSGCLSPYGSYWRYVIRGDGKQYFRIRRVICNECGKTHAILLDAFVPYSQIPLAVHHQVIIAFEKGTNSDTVCETEPIDENNVKAILRRYRRFWQQRLLSESIDPASLTTLIRDCFSYYRMQFMQIRGTVNKLFLLPT